jgi:mannosyltransferase
VARFDATTVLLRPVDPSGHTTDLWDGELRAPRPPKPQLTGNLLRRWSPWTVPALATGLVVATGLNRPGLWTDELATWGMATTPWSEFWPVLRYVDAVLAPYYVLMHLWVSAFGDSDLALRLPSLLAMVASAALIGGLGARLAGPTAGTLAGLAFAVLPSTSRYGAEVRPYALTVLVGCVATWLLVLAWERPTFVRWAGYGLAVAVLGSLHIVAVLLVAAHAWLVGAWKRRLWWRFALAAGVGVAVITPLLVYGSRQRHQVAYIAPVGVGSAVPYAQVVFGGVAIALLVALLGLFGLPLRFPSAVFTAWAVVPPLALIVVSAVLPMFLPRYLVYTTPGWCVLAGVALARLHPQWSLMLMLVVAGLGLPAQLAMRTAGGHEQQATRQIAEVLAAHEQAGDAVVYADDEPVGSWTARDAVAHYLLSQGRPRDILAATPPRHAGLLLATECTVIERCLGDTGRVWVVRIDALDDPLAGIGINKETVLRDRYRVESVWHPTGLTVALLQRKDS